MNIFKIDPVMTNLEKRFGSLPEIEQTSDLVSDIISSIVSQQLSVKAASTIWNRFLSLFPNNIVDTSLLLSIEDQRIRDQGISFSKIKYIKGVARAKEEKSINFEKVNDLSDEEVIKILTTLHGVGRWTAEMILIFSLARPNVFSLGDLGLRTAVSRLYNIDRDSLIEIEKLSNNWSPNKSLASRYLWKSLDNKKDDKMEE